MQKHRIPVVLSCLLGLLAAGCAPELEAMRADPALSHRELRAGKVAVLPVVAEVREVTLPQLRRLDGILGYAFDLQAPELGRVPSPVVLRAIEGDSASWEALMECSNSGKIEMSALRRLSRAVGARYLVFTFVRYGDTENRFGGYNQSSDTRVAAEIDGKDPNHADQEASFINRMRSSAGEDPLGKATDGGGNATSELIGYVTLVDTDTGEVRWNGQHRVRAGGGNMMAPDPPRLAWRLFSQMVARMPRPE